jgi:ubiquinone/menaquinone biosynthesis C-methylase UbiE
MKNIKTKIAYNLWAKTYDTVDNKTRDLDAIVIKNKLADIKAKTIIELGCGTGKNTPFLSAKCDKLIAVDFSKEMLLIAKNKIKNADKNDHKIVFKQADITKKWTFGKANLITCNLILEHIENLDFTFQQAAKTLKKKGLFFICEYHSFRQYQGKGARFEKDGKELAVVYFVHHISDFCEAAKRNGFILNDLQEWFDENDRTQIPRLTSFLFQKK